jgi:hypothetical protein
MRIRTFPFYGVSVPLVGNSRTTISSPKLSGMSIFRWLFLYSGTVTGVPSPFQIDFGYAPVAVNEASVSKSLSRPYTSILEPLKLDAAGFGGQLDQGIPNSFLFEPTSGCRRWLINHPIWTPDQFLTLSIASIGPGSGDAGYTAMTLYGVLQAMDDVPDEVMACIHRWGFNKA